MSLSRKTAAGVAELVGAPAPATVHAEDGSHRLELPILLATPMGIECDGLTFAATGRDGLPLDDLKAWGQRLSARLTYLMEPLALIEADALGGEVVLKSGAPSSKNGRRTYYEVRIDRSGILKLARLAFDESARSRQAVPCQFTSELLERLIDDLVATSA